MWRNANFSGTEIERIWAGIFAGRSASGARNLGFRMPAGNGPQVDLDELSIVRDPSSVILRSMRSAERGNRQAAEMILRRQSAEVSEWTGGFKPRRDG